VISVPKDAEIRARAVELGLVSADEAAPLPNAIRRRVASLIFAELNDETEAPPLPTSQLLSRFTYETAAGTIQVDVTLHPTKK